MAENEPGESNPRPIIHLGLFLISHGLLVSVLCYVATILALLLLPVLAMNTYISENALMPGSASPMLSGDDVAETKRLMNQILCVDSSVASLGIFSMWHFVALSCLLYLRNSESDSRTYSGIRR